MINEQLFIRSCEFWTYFEEGSIRCLGFTLFKSEAEYEALKTVLDL